MARLNVKPTRMELNTLKERLKTATRGHKLLKDKRDELMRRFIEAVRENDRLRQKVETALIGNMQEFVLAKCLENDLMVQEIFAVPTREVSLHIETENIMSVRVPKMHAHIIIRMETMRETWSTATWLPIARWTIPFKKWKSSSQTCCA